MSVPSNSILIAIEGIDGAGKTTQVAMLRSALESIGQEVVTSKEPTTGKWGRIIRESAATGRHSVEDELELFIEDRTEHIADLVKRFMNDSDKHFSEAAWCDFVRQLVAADQRTQTGPSGRGVRRMQTKLQCLGSGRSSRRS